MNINSMKTDESKLLKLPYVLKSDFIPISKTIGLSLAQLTFGTLAAQFHSCYNLHSYILSCDHTNDQTIFAAFTVILHSYQFLSTNFFSSSLGSRYFPSIHKVCLYGSYLIHFCLFLWLLLFQLVFPLFGYFQMYLSLLWLLSYIFTFLILLFK